MGNKQDMCALPRGPTTGSVIEKATTVREDSGACCPPGRSEPNFNQGAGRKRFSEVRLRVQKLVLMTQHE